MDALKRRDICNLTESDTQRVFSGTDQSGDATEETQSLFNCPRSRDRFLSPITRTEISIILCNNSKDPSALSKSISAHPQPSSDVPPSPPPFVTQSQHHTSLSSVRRGTSLFSFPAPFKTLSPVSTFPTDCALTLRKSKGVLSVLIIHVR